MPRTYACCYCNQRFNRGKLPKHMEKHADEIPENLTPYQVAYDIINNHPNHKGVCVICGSDCGWNERTQKYHRICRDPKCAKAIKKTYQERMMKVYNKPHLMDDVNHLEKMLAHRKISGKYKWSDGTEFTYTGSYEKNFLEFLDKVMNYESREIISPGPVLEYDYKGKKHKWITDVMILPYNLIVEIKDGGDNKNGNKAWKGTREKTIAKEVMITNLGKYNYIRLTNNDFAQFLGIIAELKMQIVDDTVSPLYRIHEDASLDEAFDVTKIFVNMVKDEFKAGITGYQNDHPVKLKFGDRLERIISAPLLAAMGIPIGLGADVIVAIVKALSKIYDYKEAHKTITQKDIYDLGKAIDKIKKSLKDEEEKYKDIYENVMKGKQVYLEKALPGLISIYNIPEDKMIKQLDNCNIEELFDYEDIHFKDKAFVEKYSGKKIGYLTYKYGEDGMMYCYDTKEWFIICFDVVNEPVIQSKALSYKDMYKKLQGILWSEHRDYKDELAKLEKKYKEYKSKYAKQSPKGKLEWTYRPMTDKDREKMKKIKERYSMKEDGEIFSEEDLNKEIMEFFGLDESALTDLIKGSITGQNIRAAAGNVKQTFTGVGNINYNKEWKFQPFTNGMKPKKNEKLNLFERIVLSPLEAAFRVISIPLTLTIDSVLCIILGTKALMQKKDKAGKVSSKDLENMKKQIEEIEKRAKTDNNPKIINKLNQLKSQYNYLSKKYNKQPMKEESLPEAVDNPYMLREAQEWEHLTHMWDNAIDDIIGNVTNSPFEVNKGSYIDHDPETGKEVCVMRTIRPKAELKNREYRDKLKRQMYKLQQKINKAYNVHPSVMFIQYPIDNTNLTEGLIIGITKTSR